MREGGGRIQSLIKHNTSCFLKKHFNLNNCTIDKFCPFIAEEWKNHWVVQLLRMGDEEREKTRKFTLLWNLKLFRQIFKTDAKVWHKNHRCYDFQYSPGTFKCACLGFVIDVHWEWSEEEKKKRIKHDEWVVVNVFIAKSKAQRKTWMCSSLPLLCWNWNTIRNNCSDGCGSFVRTYVRSLRSTHTMLTVAAWMFQWYLNMNEQIKYHHKWYELSDALKML